MNKHVRNWLVTDYQDLVAGLTQPDTDDRHALAAAIRSATDVIVTFNLKVFPEAELSKFGIEAQHPGDFITHLIDLAPPVCAAAKRQRERLKNPPKSVTDFLDLLERLGLQQTVSEFSKLPNTHYRTI